MQKKSKSSAAAVLAVFFGALIAFGCEDSTGPLERDVPRVAASVDDLPARPDLQPGESNWTPDAASIASASLATTDLNTLTPQDLADALVAGPGVSVSGVTYAGVNIAGGTFSGGTGIIGIESGVILGSGNIASIPGPNTSDNITTNNGQPGDSDLDGLIPGFRTFDRSVLEFDFQCGAGTLTGDVQFNFVFTSDEYNEFTNTAFNDVFGFFLNGSNIALLPDGVTPVSINNVNGGRPVECFNGVDDDGDGLIDGADSDCTTPTDNIVGENNSNSAFYINNDLSDPDGGVPGPIDTEMDGLTVVLQAIGPLLAGTNHMKLAIADAGDRILDSNVFLEGGSFTCVIFVDIDIKPGSFPNSINPKSMGVVPVAILGSADFDVTDVDVTTLTFGPGGATPAHDLTDPLVYADHLQDVNFDGHLDLVSHYRQKETGLAPGDTEACIEAMTFGGLVVQGCDSVRVL